ncbi:MAG TPA: magnesium transporter [Chthoniobacteraceae bacterium]|jgi:magnesium transporter|nr:magnesium transporter [Chthoniobacteraceae bacterium]
MSEPNPAEKPPEQLDGEIQTLLPWMVENSPAETARLLGEYPDEFAVGVLELLNPSMAQDVLDCYPADRRQALFAAASPETRHQWMRNERYDEQTIGRLMEPPLAVCRPETTIAAATEKLRQLVKRAFITYIFVVDESERLVGVVAMREMLLGQPEQRLDEIMIARPFFLTPEMSLTDAMKETVIRHYPVYPVCDEDGKLLGVLRGQMLFEAQAVELSAQAGSMVGVEREERLHTTWPRSLKLRHPWLQLNLLTAFVAAAVVGVFQETIDRIVVLAVFLPVLAGQSGNTGCQALAVALRGLTLGELKPGSARKVISKEALLGLLNGALVGLTAGIGMYFYAKVQGNPVAWQLGLIVMMAMMGSCVISGVFGAIVPLALKRLGADPATASSIFLTTATDVASMGMFLGLATLFI